MTKGYKIGIIVTFVLSLFGGAVAGVTRFIEDRLRDAWLLVEATIIAIDNSDSSKTTISYVVNGKTYTPTIDGFSSTWQVDEKLNVFVNESNPTTAIPELLFKVIFFIGLGAAAFFALLTLFGIIGALRMRGRMRRVRTDGKQIYAVVNGIHPAKPGRNGVRSYRVTANAQDGGGMRYYEGRVEGEPALSVGDYVTVFADFHKPHIYEMDIPTNASGSSWEKDQRASWQQQTPRPQQPQVNTQQETSAGWSPENSSSTYKYPDSWQNRYQDQGRNSGPFMNN